MELEEIVLRDGTRVVPDRMLDYGTEPDYFAFVDGSIYVKREDHYGLLKAKDEQ